MLLHEHIDAAPTGQQVSTSATADPSFSTKERCKLSAFIRHYRSLPPEDRAGLVWRAVESRKQHHEPDYIPLPEAIAAECAAIRAGWDAGEYLTRSVSKSCRECGVPLTSVDGTPDAEYRHLVPVEGVPTLLCGPCARHHGPVAAAEVNRRRDKGRDRGRRRLLAERERLIAVVPNCECCKVPLQATNPHGADFVIRAGIKSGTLKIVCRGCYRLMRGQRNRFNRRRAGGAA